MGYSTETWWGVSGPEVLNLSRLSASFGGHVGSSGVKSPGCFRVTRGHLRSNYHMGMKLCGYSQHLEPNFLKVILGSSGVI